MHVLNEVVGWMCETLRVDGCLYQDDVVDFILRKGHVELTREGSDGNIVLDRRLLKSFREETENDVVWVKPDKYWRYRVKEDEPGRDARG